MEDIKQTLKEYVEKEFSFLQTDRFYQEYRDSIHYLWDHFEKRNLHYGPSRFCSKEMGISCVGAFLHEYYQKEWEDFQSSLNDNIKIYSLDELEKYIDYLKTGNTSLFSEIENIFGHDSLCLYEAKELLSGNASFYKMEIMGKKEWMIRTACNQKYSYPFTLLHEYTHKIHDKYLKGTMVDGKYDIFSEMIAYYNCFLFGEFLSQQGYKTEADLAFDEIFGVTNEEVVDARGLKNFYEMDDTLPEDRIKDLVGGYQKDYYPLCDYAHPFGLFLAMYEYEKNLNLPLEERCEKLDIMMKNSSFFATEIAYRLKDKATVKKLMKTYKK